MPGPIYFDYKKMNMWLQIIANDASLLLCVRAGAGERERAGGRAGEGPHTSWMPFIIQSDFHVGFCLACGH